LAGGCATGNAGQLATGAARVIKRQFGLTKVRFRGLAKNTAHAVTLFALSNLWDLSEPVAFR